MYWFVSLLVLETIGEGLLCNGIGRRAGFNRGLCWLAGFVLMATNATLIFSDWQIWLWLGPLSLYRLLNLGRVAARRLPQPQLNSLSLRAYKWLITGQVVVTLVAWWITAARAGVLLLNLLVAGQLLGAIVLLRASTHTWQHAHASGKYPPLTDKELPTLSVLIPARDETDYLERCLQTLVASDYPKLEILVLDDHSAERRTPEIIRSFAHDGVRFVRGGEPDQSRWLAKNYAYEQLAAEASGDLLLFCGVDVRFAPHSLRRLVTQLEGRGKTMLSVMPLRAHGVGHGSSVLQAMRYYWEICLPRRFFKRPPVLSTCWLIRAASLRQMGGFEAASRSVIVEAPLARRAVVTDSYSFIRSDEQMGLYSDKPSGEQYATSVRVRYPQLHRRLEITALASLFEIGLFLGPFVGLLLGWLLPHTLAYIAVWAVAAACLLTTYALVAVGARLTSPWFGWLLMPVAAVIDLAVLHISMWKYEFGTVEWKGRDVRIPVMRAISR